MRIKPAPGKTIPFPFRERGEYRPIPEGGAEIDPNEGYWARLLRDGDVIEVRTDKPDKTKKEG
jgi:hypothetical protein